MISDLRFAIRLLLQSRGFTVTLSLLGSFALMAMVLAAAGIYGVMAYAVAQRRLEFGIRLALGATPRDLVRLVGMHSLRLTVGIVLGLIGARLTSSLLGDLVVGVGATDPRVFAVTAVCLGSVALLASIVPALRATRIDPSEHSPTAKRIAVPTPPVRKLVGVMPRTLADVA